VIENEVNRLGIAPTLMVRKLALDYGRMVWRALELTEDRGPKTGDGGGRGGDRRRGTGDRESVGRGARSKARMQTAKWRKKARAEDRRFFGEPRNDKRKVAAVRRGPGRPRKARAERLGDAEARMRELTGDMLPLKTLRRIADRVKQWYEER